MSNMKFNYNKICTDLLKGLSERVAFVIERRFGLKTGEKETLEAIGQNYSITRERVRQIEEEGFSKIRPKAENYNDVFKYFASVLKSFGNVKKEEVYIWELGEGKYANQIFFLLTLASGFVRFSETKEYHAFWAVNNDSVESAKKVVDLAIKKLESEKKAVELDDIYKSQKETLAKNVSKAILANYLEISKRIQKNPEGLYGLKEWVEINPKGIKDKAYLIIKKHGKALHFTEVASLIANSAYSTNKKVHVATVHNELIKDGRFVLIGRGLYALQEWGYEPGVVKEVITKVLKDSGQPLTKEEIMEKVLEKRFVKQNTVLLNLQDKEKFTRTDGGKYIVREA